MRPDTDLNRILDTLNAPPDASQQFQTYHHLLLSWNHRMNLISRNDESKIVQRHFIDSLSLPALIEIPAHTEILDMGSGAGFPGIPLKIVRPDLCMTLLDSKRKKGLFLKKLIAELGLNSVRVLIGRAEDAVNEADPVDLVCSRAVADAGTLVIWGAPYLKSGGGRIVALKGPDAAKELETIPRQAAGFLITGTRCISAVPFPECGQRDPRFIVETVLSPIV